MKKLSLLLIVILITTSCGPTNFVKASHVSWSTIQLRDDLEFDRAWDLVIDVVAKRFEMEMISKEGSYARTGWTYTWNTKNKYTENYRNRVLIKFSTDKTQVEIKTEAQYGHEGKWKNGFDSRLLETIKQDIMGVAGRITR